jgi:CheY-like chemotaxis protein
MVTISAKYIEQHNQICIEIADQGFGMDKDEIEKYLDGSGKEIDKSIIAQEKEIDSYGIGMPIVFKLVRLHHGKIEVESEKNVGTKVRLYFGVSALDIVAQNVEQEKEIEAEGLSEIKKPDAKNKSILLVEDNPVNIRITARVLEKEGYNVRYVENGREVLEILDKENFDFILMDGEMPVMNGYEATKAIREGSVFKKFKGYKTIPIIALMSSSDEKTVKRALDSGMNAHVEKSTSRTRLFDVINEVT